jgi:hypothetical protein
MTKKEKARMNFQLAIELVSTRDEDGAPKAESLVDACKQCGFLKDREVRAKDELPNPRTLKHLWIGDVIDLNDEPVRKVAEALFKKDIRKVDDLLDIHPARIFNDLGVTEEQKLAFVAEIENIGVRFTSSTYDHQATPGK